MILVSGGLGFIGSALCVELAHSDHDVLAVDQRGSVDRLPQDVRARVDYLEEDVRRVEVLRERARGRDLEAIVHLAAYHDRYGPAETCKGNMEMLVGLLDLAGQLGARTFVHASSLAVYLSTGSGPYIEDMPIGVNSPTGIEAIKKIDEVVLDHVAASVPFAVGSVRLGNIYGPGYRSMRNPPSQYCHAAIGKIGESAIADWAQTPYAFADDYVHVFDCVRGLATLATADQLPHRRYNLSSGRAASPADIGRIVMSLTGQELPGADGPAAKPTECLDNSRFQNDFGWAPGFSLETGLEQYLDWLQEHKF